MTAPGYARRCGECTLCCRLVPVREGYSLGRVIVPTFDKPAGQRCQHQRRTGCAIYASRPNSCRLWSCLWLVGEDTAALSRPDRSHYVIDPAPDYCVVTDRETGAGTKLPVIQIWVDPKFPDAHRDPALRAYLERRGREGFAALIRYDSREGFVLFPPAMTGAGFAEKTSGFNEPEHSAAQIAEVISSSRA